MKHCTKCGVEKPLSEFSMHRSSRDGKQSRCKACANAYAAYAADPERKKAKSAAWYRANKEKADATAAAWSKANAARKRATNAALYAANPERKKAVMSAWVKANPEKVRVIQHNRRARKRDMGGRLSSSLPARLFSLQHGKCACCGQPLGDKYHLDHIMPISLGGANTDDNIQLLRQRCNNQKHSKHPVEFMQSRGFLL
ncbi:HNH endonuclease signature motif containing protein [Thiobacillus sp. 65-1402]|uniref:HNH endonuclease n=1 Tax=Thiobacillus sp. 65-1402 TaxID=1895861 RepID=UPI0009691D42|nr:HNH endonuclease signature motif containing protein [Thiobacillus sp. 65-1402]OJW77978.1 MAG: hypothetical protein BGO62_10425 [Thiobacillus sp. 65-1402]